MMSAHCPTTSVVIPARNEASNLQYVLPHIPSIVSEIILVDGHSTDGTAAVAQQLLPTIRIVEQTGEGKGDAIRAGLAASTGDIVVLLDADGSSDPHEIPRFVEALVDGNDFAKGSRFAKGGGSHDITLLRSMGNYVLSKLVNMLFRAQFSDLCYGYNAFWKHCLNYVEIDCDGFEVETLGSGITKQDKTLKVNPFLKRGVFNGNDNPALLSLSERRSGPQWSCTQWQTIIFSCRVKIPPPKRAKLNRFLTKLQPPLHSLTDVLPAQLYYVAFLCLAVQGKSI